MFPNFEFPEFKLRFCICKLLYDPLVIEMNKPIKYLKRGQRLYTTGLANCRLLKGRYGSCSRFSDDGAQVIYKPRWQSINCKRSNHSTYLNL